MSDSDRSNEMFPLRGFLGFALEPGEGRSVAILELGDHHMNPNGITHGAVLFTLMDTAMGSAVMSVLPEGHLCATIELQTRFHRGASDGVIRATAWITSQSRRIVHLAAETVDPDGQILASATSSFAVIPPRSEPGG